MVLEIEYERLFQRNEPESLQKFIIKFVRYNIKSTYPAKIIYSILDKYIKKFVTYTGEFQKDLEEKCKKIICYYYYFPRSIS